MNSMQTQDPSPDSFNRRLAAIMFTDVVGYTALTQRDESMALRLMEEHAALLRPLFRRHDGREIKSTGDGFLIEFASALKASQCAVDIQRACMERNQSAPQGEQLQIRIGIHLGDVVHRDGDVIGDDVNIAARIMAVATPGGICVSRQVFDQVTRRIPQQLQRLGRAELKNVHANVQIYSILLQWESHQGLRHLAFVIAHRRARLAIAGGLVFTLAGAALWYSARPKTGTAASRRFETRDRSVAVLPFASISEQPGNDYFSDGLTEELINALSNVSEIKVASRTSAFVFKGRNEDVRVIGEKLNVGDVLEGSVRRAGSRIRITAQLIKTSDGYHVWSRTYDRDLKDVFAIQEEIARDIVTELRGALAGQLAAPAVKPATSNMEAYDFYLKGRQLLNSGWNENDYRSAVRAFEKALRLDPNMARAHAGLSMAYYGLSELFAPPKEVVPHSRAAAQRALALDDSLAEAHACLGVIFSQYDWDRERAEAEFLRAIELNPSYPQAHVHYAQLLAETGRVDKAVSHVAEADRKDPVSDDVRISGAWVLILGRRFDMAIQRCRQTLQINPQQHDARMILCFAHTGKGEYTAALKEAEQLRGDPFVLGAAGTCYAHMGNRQRAFDTISELRAMAARRFIPSSCIAQIYGALGEKDQAFEWLEKAYAQRDELLSNLDDFRMDPIRSDPRYTAFLTRLSSPARAPHA